MILEYKKKIQNIWDDFDNYDKGEAFDIVAKVLSLMDSGKIRVAEKIDGEYITHSWIKHAILLSFRLSENNPVNAGDIYWYDKIPLKFSNNFDWKESKARAVPGSIVRHASYIGKNVVLMPSFVNIGAYVGDGTMVDTWATIGSCAQIGKNSHISGGAGIGGVLEPVTANPVIIEDNCFIGARSEVAEGVIIGEGSVLSMGVYIGASTKIVDRNSGEIFYGKVPPYSVVVPGTLPAAESHLPSLYCAVIIKRVDEKTRSKVSINELLRNI